MSHLYPNLDFRIFLKKDNLFVAFFFVEIIE